MRLISRLFPVLMLSFCVQILSSCGSTESSGAAATTGTCTDPFHCQNSALARDASADAVNGGTCPAATAGASGVGDATAVTIPTVPFPEASKEALHNLEVINRFRAAAGVSALVLDKALSTFATTGSTALKDSGVPHQHFADASGDAMAIGGFCGGSGGENQAPGWSAEDVNATIDAVMQSMMDEGPGGGHHDNILNPAWGKVGVGLVVQDGKLYFTNDFSPKCD